MEKQEPKPFIPTDSPIQAIFAESEFNQLNDQEKNYTYYFSKASWEGSKICYFQKSYESPAMFWILQLTFQEPLENLKKKALDNGITEDEWKKIIVYCAAFFQNTGNYLSFGDKKFIPEVSEEKFHALIKLSDNYKLNGCKIECVWERIKKFIFNYEGVYCKLGIAPEGLTGYYSADLSKEEIVKVDELLTTLNISPLNTRVGKLGDSEYIVLVASVNFQERKTHHYKESKIHVEYGDFSPLLRRVAWNLDKATSYSANKTQQKMMKKYVEHFNTGDIDTHKDSQRLWVQDKGPIIETNIGFIETYMDPMGVRAEFEGFVAVVDKDQSYYTNQVVINANKFLEKLPWPKEFEKDVFLKPDFTSLSIVAFGCSGTPLGINIPNYDDIRQEDGFKNVFLGNVSPKLKEVRYVEESLGNNLIKLFEQVIFHKVVYHELLGHGCGKLLAEKENGELNFDRNTINPVTGKPVETWYKANETWGSKFGKLSNPYEECRADSVALYFSCFPEAYEVLQPDHKDQWKDIMYGVWTEFVLAGVNGLEYYDPENKRFLQAHINGRFVILSVLLEAGNNFIKIEKTKKDHKDWIFVNIDKEQILTTGLTAIKNFLLKLNVFKATADIERGREMYEGYSKVNDFFLDIRKIILDNKKPRRIELQGHVKKCKGALSYVKFEETHEQIVESFAKRFDYIDNEFINLWEEYHCYFKPYSG
jgi:dipeptidyl-peptidase-3